MRQWLGIVLSVLLAFVLVNDVSRLAAAHFALENIATIAADEAAASARGIDDDVQIGYQAAKRALASEDATITGYTHEGGAVHVWVEGPVEGTFILGPIVSLWSGDDWNDPWMIRKDHERRL
jgi:hypothetical protein